MHNSYLSLYARADLKKCLKISTPSAREESFVSCRKVQQPFSLILLTILILVKVLKGQKRVHPPRVSGSTLSPPSYTKTPTPSGVLASSSSVVSADINSAGGSSGTRSAVVSSSGPSRATSSNQLLRRVRSFVGDKRKRITFTKTLKVYPEHALGNGELDERHRC